jgi:hypothetical protein
MAILLLYPPVEKIDTPFCMIAYVVTENYTAHKYSLATSLKYTFVWSYRTYTGKGYVI